VLAEQSEEVDLGNKITEVHQHGSDPQDQRKLSKHHCERGNRRIKVIKRLSLLDMVEMILKSQEGRNLMLVNSLLLWLSSARKH
jgi:hypothetical protein